MLIGVSVELLIVHGLRTARDSRVTGLRLCSAEPLDPPPSDLITTSGRPMGPTLQRLLWDRIDTDPGLGDEAGLL